MDEIGGYTAGGYPVSVADMELAKRIKGKKPTPEEMGAGVGASVGFGDDLGLSIAAELHGTNPVGGLEAGLLGISTLGTGSQAMATGATGAQAVIGTAAQVASPVTIAMLGYPKASELQQQAQAYNMLSQEEALDLVATVKGWQSEDDEVQAAQKTITQLSPRQRIALIQAYQVQTPPSEELIAAEEAQMLSELNVTPEEAAQLGITSEIGLDPATHSQPQSFMDKVAQVFSKSQQLIAKQKAAQDQGSGTPSGLGVAGMGGAEGPAGVQSGINYS
jgi:hypothetical protein